MNWLAVILAVIKAIAAAVEYLRNKQAIDEATAVAISKHLLGARDEIEIATKARAAVRDDIAAHPETLRDDDGFRRP